MATLESLEAKLNEHILEDAEKHGETLAALGRIETGMKYIVRDYDKLADEAAKTEQRVETDAEKTGTHRVKTAEEQLNFWRQVFWTIVGGIVVAGASVGITLALHH